MLSVHPDAATQQQGRLDWHGADDLILRARRQRDRWIGERTRAMGRWLARSALGRLAANGFGARSRRAEIRELLALDERTLRDIGLAREDLIALAHGETTLERLNAHRLGGARGALVELKSRTRKPAPALAELSRAA
ncbi:MAG: DUF1127 domain-containing protein [Geminicoccaceae bacterium]|nr:DUF1127 domain-containing protein [Geminicoccaceae bacterium]